MNRKQFFSFFKHVITNNIERKYFDECWNTFEKYQKTNHNKDFPFSIDAPKEVTELWFEMWRNAIYLHSTRTKQKGGK